MIITKTSNIDLSITQKAVLKTRLQTNAKTALTQYKFTVDDQVLNNYLLKTTKKDLHTNCLELINNIYISIQQPSTIKIYWVNSNLDTLALFITRGNTEVYGSKILYNIF